MIKNHFIDADKKWQINFTKTTQTKYTNWNINIKHRPYWIYSIHFQGIPTDWSKPLILPGYGGKFYLNKSFKKVPPPKGMVVYKGLYGSIVVLWHLEYIDDVE